MEKYGITAATFDKLAEKYQQKYMDWDCYHDSYDAFLALLPSAEARILEPGCGPGNVSRYLLDRRPGLRITGLDLAPAMVALARANNPEAEFLVMDCRDIAALPGPFDAIFCGFCLPYLSKPDAERLINDAKDLLAPGGLLYLSTMEDDDRRSGFQSNGDGDRVYIHYHQGEHLSRALTDNGFDVLDLWRQAFPVEQGQPGTDLFILARAHEREK
ncbi:class I SAM-dependent methyltransferase [Gallaecimonas sp. GXIMD4217]|uniref:class I SAM-dependent methyltransferase n=1 Tax=Gallaecimonas sp. GXIMD4217 TaxID=3131927 RepID=UPI00311B3EC9